MSYSGRVVARENQSIRLINIKRLSEIRFPEANLKVLDLLLSDKINSL